MERAKKTIKAMRAISDITEGVIPNSLKVALDMAQAELLRYLDAQLSDDEPEPEPAPVKPKDAKLEVISRLKRGESVKDIAQSVGYSQSAIYTVPTLGGTRASHKKNSF